MKAIKWIGSKLWKFIKWLFKTLFKLTIGCMGIIFLMCFISKHSKSEETEEEEVELDGYTYRVRKGELLDKALCYKGAIYDDKEFVELLKMEEES